MLDEVFKKGRQFLGIPVAILLVAVIALTTGGTALAAYLTQEADVQVTVMEPLTYVWGEGWTDDPTPVWQVNLYACEMATNTVLIHNAASVDVPVSIQANTSTSVDGINCIVSMWYNGELMEYVPAGETVNVDVTVVADCGIDLSQGPAVTEWTLQFTRG